MRRYFYNSNSIISKWLEKNAMAKSYEDSIYRTAFLAAVKNDSQIKYENLREQILDMTIQEQLKYANNLHIQQLFLNFHLLHKYSRGREMIVDNNTNSNSTDLVDPDKFPIWDLKKYNPIYRSLWSHYLADLKYDIGFQPIIRDSQVQHIAGGRGVYAVLSDFKTKITPGEFIGLVPGKIFTSFQDFKTTSLANKKQYQRLPQHLHFPSGKILQLGDIPKQRKHPYGLDLECSSRVDATYHNPYAVGHMINHPPPGYQANVCFSEINIQTDYFSRYLLRYLPYEYYTTQKKQITLFGIFALKEIEHKEELFVNYNESHIYPIDDIPEWLIEPPKFSPIFNFLKKGEYELAESSYWKYMQKKALQKNQQLLQKYEKMKILRPDAVQFEDESKRYKKLKMRMQDQNQYEHI